MKKKAETILIVLGVFLTTFSLFDDHSDEARFGLALGTSFICLGFLLKQGFKKEKSSNLKKCPYCAEEIKCDATKCRFCGEPVSFK